MDEEKFVDTVEKDGEEYQIRDQRVNGLENRLDNKLAEVEEEVREKQDKLVSGVNIKTVNHQDLLGAGNINLSINPENYYTKEETIEVVDEKTAVVDNKLDANVHIESNQDEITYNGDTVTKTSQYKNLKTGATGTRSEVIHLANSTTAGLMAHADYNQIRSNTSRIEALEGQTKRLLYTEKTNPTAQEIQDFVDDYLESIGVTPSPQEYVSIGVVVSGTYHIWHYYTDPGEWRDDGVDTVTQFTNDSPGVIQGKATDGFVYAENDGTGSVYGWDNLKNRVSNVEDNQSNFVSKTTNPDKVYGTDSNGNQTTYNKDDFGQVEDVQVNGTSVVIDKVANIDLSNYVDLTSNQTISGVKTFSNGVETIGIYAADGVLKIDTSGGVVSINNILRPATNRNRDLGTPSYYWRNLYLSGNISDGTNSVAIAQLSGVCGSYSTNSTTQLEYSYINNISISTDTTFTLATAPSDTYPEYKANITNSSANDITITLPSGTSIKGNVSISSNAFVIPSGSTVEVNIQNNKAIVVEW